MPFDVLSDGFVHGALSAFDDAHTQHRLGVFPFFRSHWVHDEYLLRGQEASSRHSTGPSGCKSMVNGRIQSRRSVYTETQLILHETCQ